MIPLIFSALEMVCKGTLRVRNRRANRDLPNYCIIKIGQNSEKSSGDLKSCNHSDFSKKPSANAGGKKLARSNIIMPTFAPTILHAYVCACVCVCVRERERERESCVLHNIKVNSIYSLIRQLLIAIND